MSNFWKPKRAPEQNIDTLVELASKGKMSRRRLIASLTALGASASAVGTFVAASAWLKDHNHTTSSPHTQQEQRHLQQHDQHISAQTHGANSTPNATPTPDAFSDPTLQRKLDGIMADYHPDAIVEDMLSHDPIQGHAAIRRHKAQEFLTFSQLDFRMTRRYAIRDQMVAEWVASGTLNGEFKGLIGNGDAFEIPGVTVVTRDASRKIVKESIYYNLTEVKKYLRFVAIRE
ncbi:MAG TPA: ester cyclase [Ktedonobacteraceae bacterium]